jgi:hypothetical protein
LVEKLGWFSIHSAETNHETYNTYMIMNLFVLFGDGAFTHHGGGCYSITKQKTYQECLAYFFLSYVPWWSTWVFLTLTAIWYVAIYLIVTDQVWVLLCLKYFRGNYSFSRDLVSLQCTQNTCNGNCNDSFLMVLTLHVLSVIQNLFMFQHIRRITFLVCPSVCLSAKTLVIPREW